MESMVVTMLNELRRLYKEQEAALETFYSELDSLDPKEDKSRVVSVRADIKTANQNKKCLLNAITEITKFKIATGE